MGLPISPSPRKPSFAINKIVPEVPQGLQFASTFQGSKSFMLCDLAVPFLVNGVFLES